jgi:predicted transcriptional regulator
MNKESKEKAASVLREAATTVRKYAAENKVLRDKLAAKETRERVEKVAAAMHDKGIRLDETREDLADSLEKEAQQGRLAEIERAVDYVGPDMGKFAQIRNDDQPGASSGSNFERWVLGGLG